ncbi:MAG: hypothetical protein KDB27_31390 [Planctomycetales bacterium]|nr:hypothetical protein [Planctomycetales bacterium]
MGLFRVLSNVRDRHDFYPQDFDYAERQRPDFRLVITFLWHDLFDVDTEGNSHNPASQHGQNFTFVIVKTTRKF